LKKIKVAAASIPNYIGGIDRSIAKFEEWVIKAKEEGVELILFPELSLTGYITNPISKDLGQNIPGSAVDKVINIARKYSIFICFGIIERFEDRIFCSQVLVGSDGIVGKQRKIHVPQQEVKYWEAGDSIEVFDIGLAKVGISICRDSFFPEYQRTLYNKGAEIVLMPFSYYNLPRNKYLNECHHGRTIQVNSWNNGFFTVFCNNAENRPPNQWEKKGRKFPGWAGIIDPWGQVIEYTDEEGNNECMVVAELDPEVLKDRRCHPNFLAEELRTELYKFS